MGYNKDNLIQIDLTDRDEKKIIRGIKKDLLTAGLVENTSESMLNVLYMGSTTQAFSWQGKNPKEQILVTQNWVSPEYIPTTGMQINEGRNFYSIGKQDSSSVIVNETLGKLIDPKNVIGKIITRGNKKFSIIGIVSDVIYGDMYGKSGPMIFLCYPDNYNYLVFKSKNQVNTQQALAKMERIIRKYDPDFSDYRFVDDDFNKIFQNEMLTSKLSRIFAILAISISHVWDYLDWLHTPQKKEQKKSVFVKCWELPPIVLLHCYHGIF